MTFRTRKNKTRVLIAFGKGIASTLALELAMLFCHAGADVKTAFIDNGNEWLAEAPLKSVTGNSVLSAASKPSWFYSEQHFAMALVVCPSGLTQQQLCNGSSNDPIIEFIMQKSQQVQILQSGALLPAVDSYNHSTTSFTEIPAQTAQLHAVFNRVFADCTARLAALKKLGKKTFTLNYAIPQELKQTFGDQPAWLYRLERALQQAGLTRKPVDAGFPCLAVQAYDGPSVTAGQLSYSPPSLSGSDAPPLMLTFVSENIPDSDLSPDTRHIFLKRRNNGLQVIDSNGSRLLPDLSGHCAYARLAAYLTTLMQRVVNDNDKV